MKAQLCPVCQGEGKLYDCSDTTDDSGNWHTCHGCDGKGWISLPEDYICYWPTEDLKVIAKK